MKRSLSLALAGIQLIGTVYASNFGSIGELGNINPQTDSPHS